MYSINILNIIILLVKNEHKFESQKQDYRTMSAAILILELQSVSAIKINIMVNKVGRCGRKYQIL